MKILVAIVTCAGNSLRTDAQRKTFVPQVSGADVRFFSGDPSFISPTDVYLPVGDGYLDLSHKVRAVLVWALDHGYDYICKVDDDVYVRPERLLSSGFEHYEYSGACQPKNNYASGFIYWLSRRAAGFVVDSTVDDWAEDRRVGGILRQHDIVCHHDPRYAILYDHKHNKLCLGYGPRYWNEIIAAGELEPENLLDEHSLWCDSIEERTLS